MSVLEALRLASSADVMAQEAFPCARARFKFPGTLCGSVRVPEGTQHGEVECAVLRRAALSVLKAIFAE